MIPNPSVSLTFICWLIACAVHNQIAEPLHLTFELPKGTQLYYTTDGSNPYPKGKEYTNKGIDRYYIAEHFGIAEDSYDMIEGSGGDVLNGSNEDFIALLQTVYNSDLAVDSAYEKIIAQIDLANYIDYNLFQTFFCNMDWPGNNVKFWRPKEGKWRWIFFDGDLTMSPYEYNKDGGFEHNALAHAIADTNNQWYNQLGSTYLLRNLMKNEQFRTALIDRYEALSREILNPDRLFALLDRYEADYRSEMKQQIERWNYPSSLTD